MASAAEQTAADGEIRKQVLIAYVNTRHHENTLNSNGSSPPVPAQGTLRWSPFLSNQSIIFTPLFQEIYTAV